MTVTCQCAAHDCGRPGPYHTFRDGSNLLCDTCRTFYDCAKDEPVERISTAVLDATTAEKVSERTREIEQEPPDPAATALVRKVENGTIAISD